MNDDQPIVLSPLEYEKSVAELLQATLGTPLGDSHFGEGPDLLKSKKIKKTDVR